MPIIAEVHEATVNLCFISYLPRTIIRTIKKPINIRVPNNPCVYKFAESIIPIKESALVKFVVLYHVIFYQFVVLKNPETTVIIITINKMLMNAVTQYDGILNL